MYEYHIHVEKEAKLFYKFTSSYRFKIGEEILVKKEGKIYSTVISSIKHDLTKENIHTIQLFCEFNKLFT